MAANWFPLFSYYETFPAVHTKECLKLSLYLPLVLVRGGIFLSVPGQTGKIRNDPYGCDTPDGLDIRASSTMDCTGLIPSLPESDAELESYAELYHYPADIFKG